MAFASFIMCLEILLYITFMAVSLLKNVKNDMFPDMSYICSKFDKLKIIFKFINLELNSAYFVKIKK